jgi:predicted  nucleic acid-binding Zn-ribbon protein
MTQTPFEQFISLVEVDQKINGLNKSIKALEKENAAHKQSEETNIAALEKIKQKLHDMRKEVDAKELEMKTLDSQEAEKKKRLETVGNHKEYSSIKAEIDQLKKAQHTLEDTLVQVWNQLETVKKEAENATQQYEQQHQKSQELIQHNDQKILEVNQQIAALTQERTEKEKAVPAEWIEKYGVMRARVTDPVVPVVNGSCSACFYKISAQDMQFLTHRRLVQCKDCFRLLYLPEVQQGAS